MIPEEKKALACAEIDRRGPEILSLADAFFQIPELGYREEKTAALVCEQFQKLGLTGLTRPARTGVKAWARGQSHLAGVAVLGELDAVPCPGHPCADSQSGAAHACGHHAQLAALLGCAMALQSSGVMRELDGDVCFLAAPAEEYVEIEWRKKLRQNGQIGWLGGKQQLIAEGAFDDVDMAMMVHAEAGAPHPRVVTGGAALGFIGKTVRFGGREAHAGGAPWQGINALNAAALAMSAIAFQRETFRDEDRVRVHPILTKGGDAVNTVPADVRMESYVRAAGIPALRDANAKVNRAIRGAAWALGAQTEICDLPGYLPLCQNPQLGALFGENARFLLPGTAVENGLPFCGSTDLGDLGAVLPVIQPTVSGFSGALHGREFAVSNPELAVLAPAKLLAMTVIDLLSGGARLAREVRVSQPRRGAREHGQLWGSILQSDEEGARVEQP